LQPGAGGCKPQRPHIKKFLEDKKYSFLRRVRPLSRLQQAKKSLERREAKLLTRSASNQKLLGRAWCGHARPLYVIG